MKTLLKMTFYTVGGIFLVIMLASLLNGLSGQQTTQPGAVAAASQAQASPTAPQNPQPPPNPSLAIPASEQNFINIVANFASQYGQAANDMQKGAIRRQRAAALCAALKTTHLRDWVGQIATLDATGKGNGVLAVQITDDLTLSTWNNDISDIEDNSAIPAASPLFTVVSAMKLGQTVIVSGDLFPSADDCFEEQSLTTDGGMTAPTFTIRFTAVRPAQ